MAGRLSVGAVPSIALYVLPRLIRRFQQRYPKVTFELFEDTTDKLAQRLEDGTLDVVLASSGDEPPTLERHSLGEEPLLLLVPEKHRLARKKRIKWSDLAAEKFLLLHEVHSLSMKVRQLLTANKLNPEVVLQGAQLVTIASMVAAGLGVTVIPQMMVESEFTRRMRGRAFCPPGADARADFAAQSSAVREQGCRSVPRGSRGSLLDLTSGRSAPTSTASGENYCCYRLRPRA